MWCAPYTIHDVRKTTYELRRPICIVRKTNRTICIVRKTPEDMRKMTYDVRKMTYDVR